VSLRVTGLFYIVHSYHSAGRFTEALEQAHALLSLLDGRETERFGLSGLPYSGTCAFMAEGLAELGDHAGAMDMIRRAESVADGAGHLYSQMVVAAYEGRVLAKAGNARDAIAILERTAATCRERHFPGQLINALNFLGHAYVIAGRPADAIAAAQEAIDLQEGAKVYVHRAEKLTTLVRAYTQLGELERAEDVLTQALDFAERLGERAVEAWARLAGGELALRRGDRRLAEQYVDEAQEIAEELGMAPLIERCRAALRQVA
jgi:tetratricopeptide (TPR) repeat protein